MMKNYEAMESSDEISIFLNGNENGYNPFKEKIESILLDLKNIDLNRYPNNEYLELRKAYSKYVNLSKDNLIVGNGSDEMLGLVISKFISKGKKLLTFEPDFGMYDFYCESNEGNVEKIKINPEIESIDVNEIIEKYEEVKPALIIFSNPNNPTGMTLSRDGIRKILECCNESIIVVDEAYYEFFGKSVVDLVEVYENLLVTRTLSKAFGMASLRVGFLIGNQRIIETLSKYKVPYNINSYSSKIAVELLNNVDEMKTSVNKIIDEREYLFHSLSNLNFNEIRFFKSKGNYIFGNGKSSKALANILKEEGILIRNFNNNSIRITVGSRSDNIVLINVLKNVMKRGVI